MKAASIVGWIVLIGCIAIAGLGTLLTGWYPV
jgi:hypothetical protein